MTGPRTSHPHLLIRANQPLIGIPLAEQGREITHFFTEDDAANAAVSEADIQAALAAIGTFSDLDFDEMLDDLDRIRHQSPPTPPIDLDL